MLTEVVVKQAKAIVATDGKFKGQPVRTEIADASRDGLRLVVQPSGAKSFIYRYTFGGTYKKLTLGSYPTLTFPAAIKLHRDAADVLAQGSDPAIAFRLKRSGGVSADDTVTAFVESFKRQRYAAEGDPAGKPRAKATGKRRKISPSTQRTYYNAELERLIDKFGAKDIRKVTPADLQRYVDDAVERGDAAQRTCWRVLKAFFAWAAPRAGIDSPMADIEAPSEDAKRDRFLTDAEIKVVWKSATDALNPPGALVRLLLLTGCRRDEIARLTRDQVKSDRIVFPQSKTKNGEAHSVPRTWLIDKVLAELPKSGKFVLTGGDEGHGGHTKSREAIKDGLPHWTFHDLRRTMATGLARLGEPIQVTERCLNHKSGPSSNPLVTIYQRHDYAAEVQAAFEKWTDHVAALVGEKRAKAAA